MEEEHLSGPRTTPVQHSTVQAPSPVRLKITAPPKTTVRGTASAALPERNLATSVPTGTLRHLSLHADGMNLQAEDWSSIGL